MRATTSCRCQSSPSACDAAPPCPHDAPSRLAPHSGFAVRFADPAAATYKSHSGGILDVLEDMKEKAEGQLSELRKAEAVHDVRAPMNVTRRVAHVSCMCSACAVHDAPA